VTQARTSTLSRVSRAQQRTESADTFVEIAIAGLRQMFLPGEGLFCHVLRRNSAGKMVCEGTSHRYSMMTVLGLHRLESVGTSSPVALAPIVHNLNRDLDWINNLGDLGVLLWMCAVVDPGSLESLLLRADLDAALTRFEDARCRSTTELAWFLAGLSHAKLALPSAGVDLNGPALATYNLLASNQGPSGIFGHLARNASLAGRLRGRIGTFADQVYPIYSLAKFGHAFGAPDALRRARNCASRIVELQGPKGEWWWHYDSVRGTVTRPYPVYSVHQDGMGPMALFALTEQTGDDFTDAVERGFEWITGENALGLDMRDPDMHLIWRNISLGTRAPVFRELRYLARPYAIEHLVQKPQVTYECRPYELGWALYALADRKQSTK
jgi:hypothetical protein